MTVFFAKTGILKKKTARLLKSEGFTRINANNGARKSLVLEGLSNAPHTNQRELLISAADLADRVDKDTFCVCYFGGDPTPQMPHALATSRMILKKHPNVRICFETNGSMNKSLAKEMAKVALKSRGVIKFDLKAFDERLHLALTGVSNKWTLGNFKMLATQVLPKADHPFLVASTLLVPQYINEEEIAKIAKFIAKLNPQTPYSLLGFYGAFEMNDLPITSRDLALRCYQAAKKAGLKNVNLGNVHLLA